MVLVPQGIDDQGIEVMEQSERGRRDSFDVGEVGKRAERRVVKAVSVSADVAVVDLDRGNHEAIEIKRGGDRAGAGADVSGLMFLLGEGPGKHAFQTLEGLRGAEKRKGGVAMPAEGAKFVESRDVVEVRVRVEDSVD
jgi:hypothetical protein